MSDIVIDLEKHRNKDKYPHETMTPSEWLRHSADVLDNENSTGKTRTILALALYEEHGSTTHMRLWRYNGTMIETLGVLKTVSHDLLKSNCKDD